MKSDINVVGDSAGIAWLACTWPYRRFGAAGIPLVIVFCIVLFIPIFILCAALGGVLSLFKNMG